MNQKKMISAALMAASIFAIVGIAGNNAQAYNTDDLTGATTGAYNVAKNARISAFAMETCTNQMTSGDLSHVDSCISLIKIFDKYMSQAVSEANADIRAVTGYGTGY